MKIYAICLGVIWLGAETTLLKAQSRITVRDLGASPSGQAITSNLLAVQNYAVIDISGAAASSSVVLMALNDAHEAAFTFGSSGIPPQIVKTWKGGVIGDAQTIPSPLTASILDHVTALYFLCPNGDMRGNDVVDVSLSAPEPTDPDDPDAPYPGRYIGQFALKVSGGVPSDVGLAGPYKNRRGDPGRTLDTTQLVGASAGSYLANGYYTRIDRGGGQAPFIPATNSGSSVSILVGGKKTVLFDPLVPADFADTASYRFVRKRFGPAEINDVGWALGDKLWNDDDFVDIDLGNDNAAYGLTNEGRFLMGLWPGINGTDDHAGGFWQDGKRTQFSDLIKTGPWSGQIKMITPLLISNEHAGDGAFQIVTSVKDNGADELVLWTSYKVPGTSSRQWELSRMEFPAGADIQWDHLEVISSSGIIAAIGNPGPTSATPGADHALLLVPIGLRLLNGKTTDFDGKVVKRIIPSPENPHYADDKAEQQGDDILGERPPGKGRRGGVSYISDIMVAAQAPAIPWLHYKWKRTIAKLGWNILRSDDGTSWNVKLREGKPPGTDDEGDSPLNSNNIPSLQRSEFYTYDDTGMRYDPSRPAPFGLDGEAKQGDYAYSEKLFTYEVLTSSDNPGWTYGDADWKEGVTMYVSQTGLVKQVALTFLITKDWKGIYNRVLAWKREPMINEAKVRGIVGGHLPINIESGANDYPPLP